MDSAKRYAPATLRNREPIGEVLLQVLPQTGQVLEIGSGSGEHAVFFAASFPALTWQPTDAHSECLASIAAWRAEADLPNLRAPRHLDVCGPAWPAADDQVFDAVVNINMIHIAAWEVCQGLMAGAARVLRGEGILLLYGPFKVAGRHTAPSNAAFDASLKAMDPRFGVRDVAAVAAEAARHGLMLEKQVQMPANNFLLVFRRQIAARDVR
jgi:cyclopropane fatty-acyl-phospholipid synthase-like methyltransferase